VPCQACFLLHEQCLLGDLKCTPAGLPLLPICIKIVGELVEVADIKPVEISLSILKEKTSMFVTTEHDGAREFTFDFSYAHTIRDNALSGSIAGDVVFPYYILLYVR